MAKKKKADSLYELISSGKDRQEDMEMNVPAWMSGQHKDDALDAPEQPTEPVADSSQEPDPAEVSVAPPSPVVTAAGASVSSPSPASHRKDLPLVSTADGRLTFSLNHVSCVVVAVGPRRDVAPAAKCCPANGANRRRRRTSMPSAVASGLSASEPMLERCL